MAQDKKLINIAYNIKLNPINKPKNKIIYKRNNSIKV